MHADYWLNFQVKARERGGLNTLLRSRKVKHWLKCTHTKENVAVVEVQILNQKGRPQTQHSICQILRETRLSQSSVEHIIHCNLGQKCLKRCHAEALNEANCHALTTPVMATE